jgi:tRNA A37 threonylcarbamoyladenosine modification protein TsaB
MDKKIICGVSAYSSYVKLSVSDGIKHIDFSKQILNFEDIFFDKLSNMVKKFNCKFSDISEIDIIRGPGRFTGIRSLYTFAKVYNVLSGARVYGIDVFEALVYNLYQSGYEGDVAVVVHAFKDEFYLCYYRIKNKKIIRKQSPEWIFIDKLKKKLGNFKGVLISDFEDYPETYSIFNNLDKAPSEISKIIPYNIIKASKFFSHTDISPFYLKPAKFEL